MKTFHAVSESVILGVVALGSLVFVLVTLGHAISHGFLGW